MPKLNASARTTTELLTVIGPLYSADEKVGVLPSSV